MPFSANEAVPLVQIEEECIIYHDLGMLPDERDPLTVEFGVVPQLRPLLIHRQWPSICAALNVSPHLWQSRGTTYQPSLLTTASRSPHDKDPFNGQHGLLERYGRITYEPQYTQRSLDYSARV